VFVCVYVCVCEREKFIINGNHRRHQCHPVLSKCGSLRPDNLWGKFIDFKETEAMNENIHCT
jgi:hypothetical protein